MHKIIFKEMDIIQILKEREYGKNERETPRKRHEPGSAGFPGRRMAELYHTLRDRQSQTETGDCEEDRSGPRFQLDRVL